MEPKLETIVSSQAIDSAELPWASVATTGAALPAKTTKAVVHMELSAVAAVVMDVAVYGRRKSTGTRKLLGTVTALQSETDGAYDFEIENPELFDRIAVYVNGATWSSKTLSAYMICSERPGIISSAITSIVTYLAALYAAIATIGSAVKATALQIAGSDGTNARLIHTDTNGDVQVDVLSSALPTGAATDAKSEAMRLLLATIDGDTSNIPVPGADVMANSMPVTVASNDTLTSAIKTAAEALSALVANSALTTLLKSPAASQMETARSADHSGVPSSTDGVAVPAWARNADFIFTLLTGGGASTVPITLYGRLKDGSNTWVPIPGATLANLDSQTNDIWLPAAIPSVDIYDYVAAYTNGSAGTFTYNGAVVFS